MAVSGSVTAPRTAGLKNPITKAPWCARVALDGPAMHLYSIWLMRRLVHPTIPAARGKETSCRPRQFASRTICFRFGLLRQGYGSIRLAYRPQARDVIEEYLDEPARGFSTENNISCWFFLRALGQLTSETRWTQAADRIRGALLRVAWDEHIGQFDQGFSPGGQRDATKALDCASWGALFLLAAGETDRAHQALRSAENYYASRDGDAVGYRPYSDERIFSSFEIGKFYFPATPRIQWQELPLVWSEGTLGVALAYARTGQSARARQIIEGLCPLQVASSGLRYASRSVPHQMSVSPSVAASSWLVLLAEGLAGNPTAEQFWK
jgi:hypothetical protein